MTAPLRLGTATSPAHPAPRRRTDPEIDHPQIASALEHLRHTGQLLVSLRDVRTAQRTLTGTAHAIDRIEAALAAFAAVGERIVDSGVLHYADTSPRWRIVTAETGEVERRRDTEITRLRDDAVDNLRAADHKASFLMTGVLFLLGAVTRLDSQTIATATAWLLAVAALLFAGVLFPRLGGFRTWQTNTPPAAVLADLSPALAPLGRVAELARLRRVAATKYRLIQAGTTAMVVALAVLGGHFAVSL